MLGTLMSRFVVSMRGRSLDSRMTRTIERMTGSGADLAYRTDGPVTEPWRTLETSYGEIGSPSATRHTCLVASGRAAHPAVRRALGTDGSGLGHQLHDGGAVRPAVYHRN